MHVAFDARYYRRLPSGIGEYTRALAERLPAIAPDVRFTFWVSPTAPVRPVSPHPNVVEQVVRAGPNGLRTLAMPARLGNLSATDVFHAPFNILGRGIRCPTVVTVHDLMWMIDPGLVDDGGWRAAPSALYFRAGVKHALRRATRILAVSEATADWIARLAPEARPRVRVVPSAAAPRFAPPADPAAARGRAEALVGAPQPYLLVLGRNSPYKWHEGAVRALAHLRDRDALLVLVQRLEPGGTLARLAQELGVESRIRWLPALGDGEVLALM